MKTFQYILVLAALLLCTTNCQRSANTTLARNKINKYLELAQDTAFIPVEREKYLDLAYRELSDKKNDSLTRFYYRKTTAAYYNLESYDKTLTSARKIYNLSRDASDTLSMARALYYAGDAHYGKANNDSAFIYYGDAAKLYRSINDLGTLGEVVLYKAYVLYNIGEYDMCETEAFSALRLLLRADKIIHIYNCYNLIATALDGQNKNLDAIKYYKLALNQLDLFYKEGFTPAVIDSYRASCNNNLGGVYVKIGSNKEAIKLYNEALAIRDIQAENPALYAKLLNNLAYAKFKSGDHEDLPRLFFTSLKIRKELNNVSGIVASNKHLGEYYLYKKDTTAAIAYLKNAYDQAEQIKSHFDILTSLKILSEIDKVNGAYYSNRYIKVNDSLQEESKKNKDKFARIEYETDRLETEKEELIKRNSFIIGLSAVILLFAAAIFIIYYLNSRNKKLLLIQEQQKANEEIYQLMFEQQTKIEKVREEEKSRIAMELHDGILNNIYAVRLNLEFINKRSDEESVAKRKEYIKELQKVETEIRGVSHELSRNIIYQEKSFKDLLESMIISQVNPFNTIFEANLDPDVGWEDMPNTQKVNIYRIIQEGLQNINKYSGAEHAIVQVRKEDNNINIVITDDGVGFDPEKAKGGIGIKNLRKRTASLSGHVDISSEVGSGATIRVVFPC